MTRRGLSEYLLSTGYVVGGLSLSALRQEEEVLDDAGSRSPGSRSDFQPECILRVPIACSMEIS